MSERKREAFDKWAVKKLGSMATESRHPEELLLMEMTWSAYQQAFDDMYPVFDRIEKLVKSGGDLYGPVFGTESYPDELWEIIDVNRDTVVTGETFRELCVNFILADGKEEK